MDDTVFALLDFLHVNRDRAADRYAILARPARHMSCPRACDQCFGRNAAGVYTGAAEALALDDCRLHSCPGQPHRQRRPGLARADDDSVIIRQHGYASTRYLDSPRRLLLL